MAIQWLVYQAAFVPLISLFYDHFSNEETERWRKQVKTAIAFFDRMQPYSVAAARSKDVMSKLLDAAKSTAEAADAVRRQQQALMKVKAQREQQQRNREHQQKQQQQLHARQHHLGGLITRNLNVEGPFSAHGSPVDPLTGSISPASFSSVPMGMGGMVSPGVTLQSPMSNVTPHSSNTEFRPFGNGTSSNAAVSSAMNSHMPAIHPRGIPTGFWDDMLWDTFPEMERENFAMNNGFDNGWSNGANANNTPDSNHQQWAYSAG
jgi:hypothetical protein